METIYVLIGVYRVDYFLFVDMFRQRKLNEEAVYFRIFVQFSDRVENFGFRRRFGHYDCFGMHAEFLAFLSFHSHIGTGCGIVSDKYDCKTWGESLGFEILYSVPQFFVDLLRYFLT